MPQRVVFSWASIYDSANIRVEISSVPHHKAAWEGAERTRMLREKHSSRGNQVLCLSKAKDINTLVRAHECHLLGGKRLSGELVFVSCRLLVLVRAEMVSGGLWTKSRFCSRLQLSGCAVLSLVTPL